MMYFSRAKTWGIAAICLLGALLCLPNLMPAPAAWLPWRAVHLGLDLRGGSYLLMQVDMDAVQHERLDALADGARTELLRAHVGYQNLASQPAQQRVFLHLRDPSQHDAALAALGQIPQAVRGEFAAADLPGGNLAITLSRTALGADRPACRRTVDRHRAPPHRRDRRDRSADHPPGQRPHRDPAARRGGPQPHQGAAGQDGKDDVPSAGRAGHTGRAGWPWHRAAADAGQPGRKIADPQAGGGGWRRT